MPKKALQCLWCHKLFERYFYEKFAKRGHYRYCSNACKFAALKSSRIKYQCVICNKECERVPSDNKATCGSRACTLKLQVRIKTGKKLPPRTLKYRENLRQRMLGKNGSESPGWRGGPVLKTCEFCGQDYL